jgi:hypothetical protein
MACTQLILYFSDCYNNIFGDASKSFEKDSYAITCHFFPFGACFLHLLEFPPVSQPAGNHGMV